MAITLLLLAGAIITGWSVWKDHGNEASRHAQSGRSDYVLHQFEVISLDDNGKEAFTLRAPRMQQTPGARTMDLATPLFLIPDRHGNHWEVRSQSGWISEDRNELRLRGDVVAKSPADADTPVTIETAQLNVFPRTRLAKSADVVTLSQPGSILRGRGMRADLSARRYQLLSEVKARYVPSIAH